MRKLLTDHETKYIQKQGNLPRHIDGYKLRGTTGGVIRKTRLGDPSDDEYLILPGFNSHDDHAWNGAGEV